MTTEEKTAPNEILESIPYTTQERQKLRLRVAWEDFQSDIPLPCLWVSAHVDPWLSSIESPAMDSLKATIRSTCSRDIKANAYRAFLQKIIMTLNRKILKSRDIDLTFSFRGSLERNSFDNNGASLHYHFFIWAPNNLFVTDPESILTTATTLKALWHSKASSNMSRNYKPVQIEIIRHRDEASRIAAYQLKHRNSENSYELFEDWAQSKQRP